MARYKNCIWLEHGIVFDHCNIVRYCSYFNPIHGGRPEIYENYNGERFNWRKFWNERKRIREDAKKGIHKPECKDCCCLVEKDWDEKNYIDRILLTPWIMCNSRCCYCDAPIDTNVIENTKSYKILPVMKDFIKKKAFSKDVAIDFAGGEPTLYEEFEDLLDLFIKTEFTDIVVHTNAIKYSPKILEAVEKGILKLLISTDSASKEMHERIKQVKTYEQVWNNINRYTKVQPEESNKIRLKYIIIPGINDDKEEITNWLIKSKSVGIKEVVLNLDYNWLLDNINNLTRELYDLTLYSLDKAQEIGLSCVLYPQLNDFKYRFEQEHQINN